MTRLGVITGLDSEAECLAAIEAADRPAVRAAGASPARAAMHARGLLQAGCAALLSFGVAGGLDPALVPGAVIVADSIIAPGGERLAGSPAWAERVADALSGHLEARRGAIAGADRVVATPAAKRALFEATGAVATDMESHGVAAAAAAAGVPFLAIRAVADPAARAVPGWLLGAISDDGSVDPRAILKPLLMRPWMVWALIGLAREQGRALGSLSRVAVLCGPRFLLG